MKKHFYIFLIALATSFSCFSQTGKITVEQNPIITELIVLQSEMTQKNVLGNRYKIQIFYGNNGEATEVLEKFTQEHPDWPITMVYQPPNYKVWIGDFRNRLEADRAFLKIKDNFGSAFIFQP